MKQRPRKATAVQRYASLWEDSSNMSLESVRNFMQDARKCLEAEGKGSKDYPFLKTYCDWLAHDQLSSNQHELILDSVASIAMKHDRPLLDKRVTGQDLVLIGLGALRFLSDLREFLDSISVDAPFLYEERACARLIGLVLASVADQPVAPKKRQTASGAISPDLIKVDDVFGPVFIQSIEVVRGRSPNDEPTTGYKLEVSFFCIEDGRKIINIYSLFDLAVIGLDSGELPPVSDEWHQVITLRW